MSRKRTLALLFFSLLALLICTLIGRSIAPGANARFATASAALAFITAAAIGIERAIEAFWTVIGGLKGSYWPLKVVGEQVDALTNDLDMALAPVHAAAQTELTRLAAAQGWTTQQLAAAQGELATWQKNFDKLKTLPVDNQRIQLLGAAAAQQLKMITAKYGAGLKQAEGLTEVAKAAIDGMQTFLASFKDNPGRRLISLFLGACMGVLLASGSGLDLFKAAMEAPDWQPSANTAAAPAAEQSAGTAGAGQAAGVAATGQANDGRPPIRGYLAIWLTGIIMGLGSSPTHEVIRAVQEYKKNRKGENTAKPDQP